jgi:3-methyladenine DNA glycosylase/8-oxoguanine DNA glycosylase
VAALRGERVTLVAELPPNRVELEARTLETTLPVPRGAQTVRVTASRGKLRIETVAGNAGAQARKALMQNVAHRFRLDQDLSGLYAVVSDEGDLSWCASGAGRMLRAPTVFEDVVKTICTFIQNVRCGATGRSGGRRMA